MEQNPQRFMTTSEYKVIPQGNLKISKKFFARGADKILLHSMNVVEDDVILRGDLGKISIGNSTIIDSGTVLRPSLNANPPYEYKMLKIGSNCYIGKNCIVCALSIGNNADRVEIGNNVKILDGSYVTVDSKIPDNSIIGGKPARHLEENTEAMDLFMPEYCNYYYKNLVITQPPSNKEKDKKEVTA